MNGTETMQPNSNELIDRVKTITNDSNADPHIRILAEAVLFLLGRLGQDREDTLEAFQQIKELGRRQQPR
jgi:hypothetical protein